MSAYNARPSQAYSPSAPPLPEFSSGQQFPSSNNPSGQYQPPPQYGQFRPPSQYGQGFSSGYSSVPSQGGYFPPGTHPEIIRSFQNVDKDRSGFIDENELQEALSSGHHRFNLRTIRLLMFLFKNPYDPLRMGPNEFAKLWDCLGQWRAIFERFDRDRSGEIDSMELRDALLSLGYAVPPSVLQLLISKYDNTGRRRGGLDFDNFVECGMIVKGLTEKFKEKDPRYTGSATLTYDKFMTMIIPFLVL